MNNLDAWKTKFSRDSILNKIGKSVNDFSSTQRLVDATIDASKKITVKEALGSQLLMLPDFNLLTPEGKLLWENFENTIGKWTLHELWSNVALELGAPLGESTLPKITFLSSVIGSFERNDIKYASLVDYYVANFVFPLGGIISTMNLLTEGTESGISKLLAIYGLEDIIIFRDSENILQNSFKSVFVLHGHSLETFLPIKLDKAITCILNEIRPLTDLKLFDRLILAFVAEVRP